MDRRKLITGLAGVCTVSTVGCLSDESSGSTLSEEFGMFSGPFEKVEWTLQGQLIVTIVEDHEMDGLGIKHEKVEIDDYDGYTCFVGVPIAGGEVPIDFVEELEQVYPNRSFTLVAMEGDIGQMIPIIEGTNSTVGFHVPENAVGDEHFS